MKIYKLIPLFILIPLLVACAPALATPTPTPGIPVADLIATGVMETLTAQPTATPLPTSTPEPTVEPLPTLPPPTIPVLPTMLPTSAVTSLPTSAVVSTLNFVQGKGDYACQVISQTPADWTQFKPRDIFDMKWKVKNAGTKSWFDNVELVYVSGDKIHTYGDEYAMVKEVDSGNSVVLVVDMIAPKQEGIYNTVWGLQSKSGVFCQFSLMIRVYK
jgi:hypothetical protein